MDSQSIINPSKQIILPIQPFANCQNHRRLRSYPIHRRRRSRLIHSTQLNLIFIYLTPSLSPLPTVDICFMVPCVSAASMDVGQAVVLQLIEAPVWVTLGAAAP